MLIKNKPIVAKRPLKKLPILKYNAQNTAGIITKRRYTFFKRIEDIITTNTDGIKRDNTINDEMCTSFIKSIAFTK